ncbi:uncharacterized protein CIMG_04176 [Coccidioides immitis RS]|uniref:Uncharacterized protein n=1 Tax=Coccidioides immitis (strain RS) TaxID=246410 RepID=J3KCY4_COCIM|nr:uncharacterized protein CIMG_04176 [Coccidioides immitis RS]EAS33152.3 hypothetical protein CIMG_04176 [Coccidioides immitis RS]
MFHLLKKGVAAWKDADDALDDEGTVGCPSAQCSLTVPLTNCELPVLDGYKGSKSFPMQFTNTCRPPSTRPLNNARPNPSTEAWAWANHESYISATPMHRPSDFRPLRSSMCLLFFFSPFSSSACPTPLFLCCARGHPFSVSIRIGNQGSTGTAYPVTLS